MDCEDAVAREISGIESEQGRDAVDAHKGGKAGVIDLNTGDAVRDNKASATPDVRQERRRVGCNSVR